MWSLLFCLYRPQQSLTAGDLARLNGSMALPAFDEVQFLEPAHYHDPTQISNIAAIPMALLNVLPLDAQQSLWAIQESTSVAYASYIRLQELSQERFHRLVPAKNQVHGTEAIECRCDDRLACAHRFMKRPLAPQSHV
jgi:hypothetical protein